MDLTKARLFLEKLKIKDLKTRRLIPFRFNVNQQKAHRIFEQTKAKKRPFRFIILKSRRVGMSSYFDAMIFAHCVATPQIEAAVVANEYPSSKKLFVVPQTLLASCPYSVSQPPNQHIIKFNNESTLEVTTAGNSTKGRGWTLVDAHLSECAFYQTEDSFLSILNAVSEHPESIVALESTANGRVGFGEAFYDFWKDSVSNQSDFTPIFLSWIDDPDCRRDPNEARDAPIDQEERDLMKMGLDKSQLAWRRMVLNSKCQGFVDKFFQEYPHIPEVAFISTGNPAFAPTELSYARASVKKPRAIGRLVEDHGQTKVLLDPGGPLAVWKYPHPEHRYYIGCDAAKGVEEGDFAAAAVWDGSTGEQAARFDARVPPEVFALILNDLGRWYNKAMLNVELTGGYGREVQKRLRDELMYPNFYRWKGKDDKAISKRRDSLGWEMTTYSRRTAFNLFAESLRLRELSIFDEQMVNQMDSASLDEGFRWEVSKGHDDILVANLLGWVAIRHYPPPRFQPSFNIMPEEEPSSDAPVVKPSMDTVDTGIAERCMEHADKILFYTRRKQRGRSPLLEGI